MQPFSSWPPSSRKISSRSRFGWVVPGLALFLLLPSGVHAAETGDAQSYILSIGHLYDSLEYERALDQIKIARQLPHDTEQEVTLLLYEGILLAELGKQEESTATFKAGLLLRPEARLPVLVSPKLQTHFESVRKKVKQELAALGAKREAEQRQTAAAPRPAPTQAAPAVAPPTVTSTGTSEGVNLRKRALIPAIGGGALAVAGGITWALSRGELNRLRTNAPELQTEDDARRSGSRGKTLQTLGVGLLGVGAAGLATAAGMYVLGGSEEPVALGVSTDGTSAFVFGRWP